MDLIIATRLLGLLVKLAARTVSETAATWTDSDTNELAKYSLADWLAANQMCIEQVPDSHTFEEKALAELYLRTVGGNLVTDEDLFAVARHAPDYLNPDELYCVTLDYDGEASLCTVGHDGMPNERIRKESCTVDLYNWLSNIASDCDREYMAHG